MNCFLIDFENVKSLGLKGVERLVDTDDLYIFYSDYANSITFDIHHKMNLSSANIQLFKSNISGKNALDFQLISYLGYLVAQKKYKNYYVITEDRGFESAIRFWKDFFKQNKFSDLEITRFRTIQDALDKKSSSLRQSLRKNTPTIPTVETELELRQLKAENIIIDRNSPQIEKHIEKNMVNESTDSYKSDASNKNEPVFTPISETDTQKSINNTNHSLDTTNTTANTKTDSHRYREDRFKSSKGNKSTNGGNNKNENQQNNNKKSNNQPVNNKKMMNHNANNSNNMIKKSQGITLKDSTEIKKPSKETKSISTQPKSFIFEKVDLNKDVTNIETSQKKSVLLLTSVASSQVASNQPNQSDKISITSSTNKSNNHKPYNKQDKLSEITDTSSTSIISKNNTSLSEKNSNIPMDLSKQSTNTNVESPKEFKAKRRVGRPRSNTPKDESRKPKNNKKFQEDIPNQKLTPMLKKVSVLSGLETYSNEDKVLTCKIVAFSNTKQECYQAFMSCFGKSKGVNIYKIVKQEYDALRNLYLTINS